MIAAELAILVFAAGVTVGIYIARAMSYRRGWRDGAHHMRALHISVFGTAVDYRDARGRLSSSEPTARVPDLR